MGRSFFIVSLAAMGVALGGPSLAMQLQMTPHQLCGLSDLVIIAEVTSSEAYWAAAGDEPLIETRLWLSMERAAAGQGPDTVELVVPGGTVGDDTMKHSETPELAIDRRYLLFLQRTEDGSFRQIGAEQGAVPLNGGVAGIEGAVSPEHAFASVEGCRVR